MNTKPNAFVSIRSRGERPSGDPTEVAPHHSLRLRRYFFALLLLGLTIYLLVPRIAAVNYDLAVISRLGASFIALSLMAQVLRYLGSGYLLMASVNLTAKPASIIDGAFMTVGANTVGTLGGGVFGTAAMTYFFLRRRNVNMVAASRGSWLPIVLKNIVLAIISIEGLLVMIHHEKSSNALDPELLVSVLIAVGGIWALIWCFTHQNRVQSFVVTLAAVVAKLRRQPLDCSRVDEALRSIFEGWDALSRGAWRAPLLGAILSTSFDVLTMGLLFWAIGYRVNLAVLLAGYGIPQFAGKVTLVMGGAGVVEAGMAGLYRILGVPKSTALLVILAYRLLSFWLPTLVGLALVPYLERETPT